MLFSLSDFLHSLDPLQPFAAKEIARHMAFALDVLSVYCGALGKVVRLTL
jgi:hypothetical protein